MLTATNISKRISGRQILSSCSLELNPGRLTVVVGPNGAGKSTFLKIISGEDQKFAGEIRINGHSLDQLKTRDLSRIRAILPQHSNINFPFTAAQVVEIGRFAHRDGAINDREAIHEAMTITNTVEFSDRLYHTLSGGEKQRVQMARVICQISARTADPRYLLLDEPTSSLDLAQQHVLLSLAKKMCKRNIAVLAVLHDLNLALQYADDIIMMKAGQVVASGPVYDTITEDLIEDTFGHPVKLLNHDGQPVIIPIAGKRPVKTNEEPANVINEPFRISYHGQ